MEEKAKHKRESQLPRCCKWWLFVQNGSAVSELCFGSGVVSRVFIITRVLLNVLIKTFVKALLCLSSDCESFLAFSSMSLTGFLPYSTFPVIRIYIYIYIYTGSQSLANADLACSSCV